MRRVFSVDGLECPQCSGRMRILAAIQSSEAVRAILDCLSLPSRSPPIATAAPDDLEWCEVPAAPTYDVIVGELSALLGSGIRQFECGIVVPYGALFRRA